MRRLHNRFLYLLTEKERKEGRRILQKEIAEAVGVPNHTIGRWIRDEVERYERELMERICDYFQCDIADLLYLDPEEDGEESRSKD